MEEMEEMENCRWRVDSGGDEISMSMRVEVSST